MLICQQTNVAGVATPVPFVVGVARSGTTLLRMMLDAHPQMAIPPETHFIPEVVAKCRASKNPREAFFQGVLADPRWSDFQLDAETFRKRLEAIEPFEIGSGLRAFYELYAERFHKPRWGDKTPPYIVHMRLIAELLPEARFIHLIRDGRDVMLSVKNLWFGPSSLTDAAERWIGWIKSAREQAAQLPNYLEVRYEDLLLDTEPTLQKICAFLDLTWEPQMLEYHRGAEERLSEMARDMKSSEGKVWASAEQRVDIHAMTKKPPETSRMGRWKTEMSAADREQFENAARPMLEEFGYIE